MKRLLLHVFVALLLSSHLTSCDLGGTSILSNVQNNGIIIDPPAFPCENPREYRDSRGICRKLLIGS
ncbi:uncharacterized protein LOC124362064 isoform X5 [Homalodisca vitripennis]|uniref:uncharacterized protein LOC124362064 isoform X5 n=1 Tax=Homalodisca vitripennis TaxID=197043 RepID=UPI001EEB3669|nr:uncharacterized protein LOC124362064 isoform X5 [Homalodisca vitripennis]